ncbi:MAG: LPS assembly protein LptD [Candidatus Omnitrophica bacterium]|nr:LPS assembly protein LptD [Candidatus Omnitrophota bacterium]
MFNKRNIFILAAGLIFSTLFFSVHPCYSDEAQAEEQVLKLKPGQPITVNGDEVEYFETEGRIVANGHVSILYGDVKLNCDKIEVNTRTKQAVCEGNVVITQPEGTLVGDRIKYDFTAKTGEILGGEVKAFPWFGNAKEAGKVGKNEYLLKEGYFTTCDLDEPHYRLKATEIRIFPDEKVIAKDVVFYVNKVPVLWFPYYYHPFIQSRAKVQFIPGQSSEWGYFMLSSWRFYIKGNTKVDVMIDYRSKKGFAEGVNLYYDAADFGTAGLGKGQVRTYFAEQTGFGTYSPSTFRDNNEVDPALRDRFQWLHRIDFEEDTVGMVEFNKYSDQYFLKDYFYNEYEQSNPTPLNYASVISSKENYIVSVLANARFDDCYTVTQRLPELRLDIPNQNLWNTPFYYTSQSQATAFAKKYSYGSQSSEYVNRFFTSHTLSYVADLGPVKVTPYGTVDGLVYSRTKKSMNPKVRAIFESGVDVSSRFYKVYDVNTNAFGLDINKVRHIVAPSVGYFHTDAPNIHSEDLFQMDDIDTIDKENGVYLALENKLQTKRHVNGKLQPVDLVRFIASGDYLFRTERDSLSYKGHDSFRDVKLDLEMLPYNWLYIDSQMEIDPKYQSVSSGYIEASLYPTDFFSMSFGYRYEKILPDSRNQFTFDIGYIMNEKWRFGVYERINIQESSIEEQQFSITRDLHCWEVEFVYDVDGSNFFKDDYTVWVVFRIKAFPDLQIGLDRSFVKHQPGRLHPSVVSH